MGTEVKKVEKVGGGWFFLSLAFLILAVLILLPSWLITIYSESSFHRWRIFFGGFILGLGVTVLFIRGSLNTLIHELKHNLLSGLIGNKSKRVSIQGQEGSFEYEYTHDTAKYNAFISLAPYFFPMMLLLTLPLWGFRFALREPLRVALFGLAYGIDLLTGLRDISPIQTDFSDIRGGFKIGLTYVLAMNALLLIFLTAWVAADYSGVGAVLENTLLNILGLFIGR